jgi:hypothetical protein
VTLAEAEAQAQTQGRKSQFRGWSGAQVLVATLFLAWPSFYNGFPLLYPDSMTYLDDGRIVARALFLHHFSDYYGMRSFIYSLVILPLHWNQTAWPIVALQCFLVANVLRLVIRSIAPRLTARYYLALVLLLSLGTSVGWYSSLVLPDILGSVAYLAIYLLAFARDSISRAERLSLYLIAWWGIASHATHLLLAAALCLLVATMLALQRQSLRRVLLSTLEVAAIVALPAASQLALHAYLYGHPSLNGERPPFLMARVIADGPGRWYLQQHCGEKTWAICAHVHELTDDPDLFLWSPDGIWQSASDSEQKQMLQEEVPLVVATFRAYPQAQIHRSYADFWKQLTLFGIYDLDPSGWTADQFNTVMPAARSSYFRGRQARNALPLEMLTALQFWVVMASLGVIAIFGPLLSRSLPSRLALLTAVIAFVVVVNAAITGVLSMPEDRFECRVIWLVPLLAGLYVLAWFTRARNFQVPGHRVIASD